MNEGETLKSLHQINCGYDDCKRLGLKYSNLQISISSHSAYKKVKMKIVNKEIHEKDTWGSEQWTHTRKTKALKANCWLKPLRLCKTKLCYLWFKLKEIVVYYVCVYEIPFY